MALMEKEIIHKLNQKGFKGFPTIVNKCNAGIYSDDDTMITDLIGSSLSWFNKNKPLTLS